MLTPKAHHKEETQSNTETTAEMTSMSKNFLDYSLQRAENYQQCTPAHPHLCGNTRRQQIFKAIPSLLGKAPTTLRGERLRAACSGAGGQCSAATSTHCSKAADSGFQNLSLELTVLPVSPTQGNRCLWFHIHVKKKGKKKMVGVPVPFVRW